MIPAKIDVIQIVADLNEWGWLDHKICVCCGLSDAYITQIRRGNIKEPSYGKAARLYNFWIEVRSNPVLQTNRRATATT